MQKKYIKKHAADDAVKRHIQETVDDLPRLLSGTSGVSETDTLHETRNRVRQTEKDRRKLLWTAVAVSTIAVFAVWIWQLKTTWYDLTKQTNDRPPLPNVSSIEEEIKNIFAAIPTAAPAEQTIPEPNSDATEAIKEALRAIAASSTSE